MNSKLPQKNTDEPAQGIWYLAVSKPRQEARALENLLNQGISAFFPSMNVEKVLAGKKKIVNEPMFTGYLFINISPEDGAWHKVKSTRGIRDWVKFGGQVAKLPEQLVEQLISQQSEQQQTVVKTIFTPGESVRILSGPFEGLKGIYQAKNGEERALILIDFLGKVNRLKVDIVQITADS